MPQAVLMERAALGVAGEIEKRFPPEVSVDNPPGRRVLVAAGTGNNGGDGLAAGRILMQRGFAVDFFLAGDRSRCGRETERQLAILEKYGCPIQSKIEKEEYDIVVDALFGIGLSRRIEGVCAQAVEKMNRMKAFVCSVDLPSGINTDTGEVMGSAVKADLTVTFAFAKPGQALYPGCTYTGEVILKDIGITAESLLGKAPGIYTFRGNPAEGLPKRDGGGNKGTFGKVLAVAGSVNMSGACALCAESAYRVGAGMVKALTPEENREIIQQNVPEALLSTWSAAEAENGSLHATLARDVEWADCIVAGPGLGKSAAAGSLIRQLLAETDKPLVIDADGLNLLSQSDELKEALAARQGPVILTPHVAECARLYGCSAEEIKKEIFHRPKELADMWNCVVVCKDARTVVACPGEQALYLNTSGNDGMATAGSGDVLAGIIAGLLAQGMEAGEAARLGVYIHGAAGDRAAAAVGRYALMAGDLPKQLAGILIPG